MIHPATGNIKPHTEPSRYEIRVKETLDTRWATWFEGMTISQAEDGETIISGLVMDKSALHGLLAIIGELNLTLISVKKIEA